MTVFVLYLNSIINLKLILLFQSELISRWNRHSYILTIRGQGIFCPTLASEVGNVSLFVTSISLHNIFFFYKAQFLKLPEKLLFLTKNLTTFRCFLISFAKTEIARESRVSWSHQRLVNLPNRGVVLRPALLRVKYLSF